MPDDAAPGAGDTGQVSAAAAVEDGRVARESAGARQAAPLPVGGGPYRKRADAQGWAVGRTVSAGGLRTAAMARRRHPEPTAPATMSPWAAAAPVVERH